MNAYAVQGDQNGEGTDLREVLSPIELPCGRVLPNRLVKAAMYEHLASLLGDPPNSTINALYTVWARGGWGMIITGNVQVSRKHLSLGADMVVPEKISEQSIKRFKQLAYAMTDCTTRSSNEGEMRRSLAIMQLNHTGRQSPNGLGGRWPFIQQPLSASATCVGVSSRSRRKDTLVTRTVNALLFQKARAMSDRDVIETIDDFVRGARLAVESGFDGVQIHAAHGYLIAQFISRKTNLRTDVYASPLVFLYEIVQAIRTSVPGNFVVGLKINSADYTTGGLSEEDGAAHLAEIARWEWDGAGIDFIEISGGDYESPEFMKESSQRQVFFESFSRVAVKAVELQRPSSSSRKPPLILLTGGLRTREQFSRVLVSDHAHLLGIARLAVLQPQLPALLYEHQDKMRTQNCVDEAYGSSTSEEPWNWETQPSPEPRSPGWWPRLVGSGVGMAWYVVAMRRLALGRRLPYGEHWPLVLFEMYFGDLWDKFGHYFFVSTVVLAVIALFLTR